MLVSKWQSIQLSQAQATYSENLKKQKVYQEIVKDNSYNISDNKINLGWFWHNSSYENYFDLNKKSVDKNKEKKKSIYLLSISLFFITKPAILE